jgi:hypothetical protein
MRRLPSYIQQSRIYSTWSIPCFQYARTHSTLSNQEVVPAKRTITRKKYSELPLSPNSPLGDSNLESLEKYKDSIQQPPKPRRRAKPSRQEVDKTVSTEEQADPTRALEVRERKPRRTRVLKDSISGKELQPREGTTEVALAQPARCRRRLAKGEEPSKHTLDSTNCPSSPLAVDVLQYLREFPHCILLTRVGQFYEVRFLRTSIMNRV